MQARRAGAFARSAPAGLALALVTGIARADDNDAILGAINDFCANPRGNIRETVKLVMRSPLQPRDVAAEEKRNYGHYIYLAKLGATLKLTAQTAKAPVEQCDFVGYSDDMAGLAARMRATFDLPEPTIRQLDSWRLTQRKSEAPRQMTIELQYGLQENQKAGAFNLRIDR